MERFTEKQVGKQLRIKMLQNEIGREELAEILGVSKERVSQMFSGRAVTKKAIEYAGYEKVVEKYYIKK